VNNPLVSIIIPTYNRAHLIVETLDSISKQTYTNWECVIVDDGSTDNSLSVVSQYCGRDPRFTLYQRPSNLVKGANACRNYGFEKSKGTLINWFDSDDYMLPTFLEEKVSVILNGSYDFVMATSVDWDGDKKESPIYKVSNEGKDINAFNFITQHINCITNDFMATRASIAGLRFNENLKSGQEYNFISRYLCATTSGLIIPDILSKRRVHGGSIQWSVSENQAKHLKRYYNRTIENKLHLLTDIAEIGDTSSKTYLVNSLINFSYLLLTEKGGIPYFKDIFKYTKNIKGAECAIHYAIAIFGLRYFGRGYSLFKKAKS
jgi:glycosyltransferase involved in cell wall biosynthesis